MKNQKTSAIPETIDPPTQDEIALRAHQIWLEQGCPHGHDVDNWLEAEGQLIAERRAGRVNPPELPHNVDLTPRQEDVPFDSFREEAPLATRVAEEVIEPGRFASPDGKTALDL